MNRVGSTRQQTNVGPAGHQASRPPVPLHNTSETQSRIHDHIDPRHPPIPRKPKNLVGNVLHPVSTTHKVVGYLTSLLARPRKQGCAVPPCHGAPRDAAHANRLKHSLYSPSLDPSQEPRKTYLDRHKPPQLRLVQHRLLLLCREPLSPLRLQQPWRHGVDADARRNHAGQAPDHVNLRCFGC